MGRNQASWFRPIFAFEGHALIFYGVIVSVAATDEEPSNAPIFTVEIFNTVVEAIGTVTVVAPAGTVTVAGIVAELLDEVKVTTSPFAPVF